MHKQHSKGLYLAIATVLIAMASCSNVSHEYETSTTHHKTNTHLTDRELLKGLIYVQRRLAEQQMIKTDGLSDNSLALARALCDLESKHIVHFDTSPDFCLSTPIARYENCNNRFFSCLRNCSLRGAKCSRCELGLTRCNRDEKP